MARDPIEFELACFMQAYEFEMAAECLGQGIYQPGSQGKPVLFVAAVAVSSALSLELYLKCLLHVETGKAHRGHELLTLFGLLEKGHMNRIEKLYEDERPRRSGGRSDLGLSLSEVLRLANNAFPDWRYSFEIVNRPGGLNYGAAYIVPHVKTVILEASPILEERILVRLGMASFCHRR
jgi:hypothetical protein